MAETQDLIRSLVVDDETSLLEELRDFLTRNGLGVTIACDGAEALRALAIEPAVTVVLTDIGIPLLDGLALTNRILQARGDADAIEVVLMTGHGNVESAAEAVRAGAFDFLRKPMVLRDTLLVLERAHARAVSGPLTERPADCCGEGAYVQTVHTVVQSRPTAVNCNIACVPL